MRHILGDALEPLGTDPALIAHVVNSHGVLGAGFARHLRGRFPEAAQVYWQTAHQQGRDMPLGQIIVVPTTVTMRGQLRIMYIAHLVAMRLYHPVDLAALAECIRLTEVEAQRLDARVHAPRLGAGLGLRAWSEIAALIPDSWSIYTLPSERGRWPDEPYIEVTHAFLKD